MDYVATLAFRPSVSGADRDAALMRRAAWQYPAGIQVIGEYWLVADAPQVITIFSTEDMGALMQLLFEWNDVFDVDVHPAVSAEIGLTLGAEVFGKLSRLQG